jgi:hypothetical protein
MSSEGPFQPQPPKGLDEDVEPRARQLKKVLCAKCKEGIWWDGDCALWCENKECTEVGRVYWNADLKLKKQ